jgi:hypothetical protein
MVLLLTNIITALLLFLAGLWFKNYLPNYFNEKGKLLAQKEDIEDITEKIESVKKEFAHETELLKVDLQRFLNFQVSHRSEERNAIINFYDKYNQWLYSLLEINFGAYNRGIVQELAEKRIFIEKFFAETNVAQAKLRLLVKDKEIIKLSHQLMVEILQFKAWFDKRLLGLQHNLERHNSLTDSFLIVIKNLEGNKELAHSMAEDEKNIEKEKKELVDEFYKNRHEEYSKIIPGDNQFTEIVKDYLTKW